MPFYAGIRKIDGNCESLKSTLDKTDAIAKYSKYRKIAYPLNNPIYDDISDSFREMTADELDSKICADNQAAALSKTIFSKLQIRRAMRELGNEAALDALLSASETFAKDWADAIEIDLSDAMTQQALEAMTVDIDAIKLKIAGVEP